MRPNRPKIRRAADSPGMTRDLDLRLTDLHLLAPEDFVTEPRQSLVENVPVSFVVDGPAVLFLAAGVDEGALLEAQLAIATITTQAEAG
jgi:hypothetical protein